jgi:hypothetical protein
MSGGMAAPANALPAAAPGWASTCDKASFAAPGISCGFVARRAALASPLIQLIGLTALRALGSTSLGSDWAPSIAAPAPGSKMGRALNPLTICFRTAAAPSVAPAPSA